MLLIFGVENEGINMNSRWRKVAIFIVVGVAVLVAVVVLHSGGRRSVLNRYKAELRARGERLTVEEIAIAPTTNPEYIAARQALARPGLVPTPSVRPDLVKFIGPGKARVTWRGELVPDVVPTGSNAVAPTWETFDAQVKQSEAGLSVLRDALENCPPDVGWVWKDDLSNITNWPGRSFIRDRGFIQALYNATIADLHRNDLDGAIKNLHACIMLSQLNRNEPVLVSQMIRIAIANCALMTTWETLQAPGWDERRLAALQRDWEQTSFIDGLERAFEAERAIGQVRMAKLRNSSLHDMSD